MTAAEEARLAELQRLAEAGNILPREQGELARLRRRAEEEAWRRA